MPYIKQELRSELDKGIDQLAAEIVEKTNAEIDFAGMLNYTVTRLIHKIILLRFNRLRYWHSAAVRGVLMDVADEFYRRVIAPYEDKQIVANGDVDTTANLLLRSV